MYMYFKIVYISLYVLQDFQLSKTMISLTFSIAIICTLTHWHPLHPINLNDGGLCHNSNNTLVQEWKTVSLFFLLFSFNFLLFLLALALLLFLKTTNLLVCLPCLFLTDIWTKPYCLATYTRHNIYNIYRQITNNVRFAYNKTQNKRQKTTKQKTYHCISLIDYRLHI